MKPLAFFLFALVGSMILSIPMQAYADVQLDSLLRIANQARDNIKIRLSQLETIPSEITNLYEQASAETDALAKSVSDGDIGMSKQHFLTAMKLFKETSDKISSFTPTLIEEPLSITDTSRLKTVIVRIENDANRLKAVATKNTIEIDFTEFNNLIQIAKQNLDEGNADEVNKTLGVAKQFILDAYGSISEVAKQRTTDRAKVFAAKQIESLDRLIAQSKDLGLSQDIIDNLQTAKEKLQKVSDANEIVSKTKEINTIRKDLDASTVNRLNAIIDQFESKLDNLNKTIQDTDSKAKIKTANEMIVELKQLVIDNNLRDALQKISSINEILNSIKVQPTVTADTSISTGPTNSTSKATKISDTKVERTKAKIQNLEQQLTNLSKTETKNEIANKWITRAFSLLETAKLQLDSSPDKAINTLNEIDKLIRMIQKLTS
ncbi:MAG TPA: hypothetical protein VLD38_02355 [Nitrosopumilaceae archaeon]|nr:hypothetical protein [Nitrosopumilaceae archaeon]